MSEQNITEEANYAKVRDPVTETASSHHEHHDEESASLGKRSLSESVELRLCANVKKLDHFLDSLSMLEQTLACCDPAIKERTPGDAGVTDNLTSEVKPK